MLLTAALVFVLSQAALGWALWHGRQDWRDPAFEARLRILEQETRAKGEKSRIVLAIGSSLTLSGVEARRLEAELETRTGQRWSACNLGHPGATPFTQLLFIRRLLERGIKPDLVLLEFFPPHLGGSADLPDLAYWSTPLLSRRDLRLLKRYGGAPDRSWWEVNLIPAFGHRHSLVKRFAAFLVPPSDRDYVYGTLASGGWLRTHEPPAEKRRAARDRPRQVFGDRLAHFGPGQRHMDALHEALALLKANGIQCLLVWMPEGPAMQALYSGETEMTLTTLSGDLQGRFGIPLLRTRDWMSEDCFVDSYHLSARGARLFTDRLAQGIAAAEK